MKAEQAVRADPLGMARRVVLVALSVEVTVLVVTGVWLVFNYRPSGFAGLHAVGVHYPVGHVGWIRATHRYFSTLALITSVGAAALVVAEAVVLGAGRRRGVLLVVGPLLALTVTAATFTGYLLPWDQLALWAVTAGADFKGYKAVFGSDVRFVLLGGSEVSQSTMWRWFIVHAVVLTLSITALLGAAARLRRPRSRPPSSDSATEDPVTTGQ